MTIWEAETAPVTIAVTVRDTERDTDRATDYDLSMGGTAAVLTGLTSRGEYVAFAVDPEAADGVISAAQRDGQTTVWVEGWQLLATPPQGSRSHQRSRR